MIAAEMAISEQHMRWASTKGCPDTRVPESRAFRQDYKRLKTELAASVEAARIDAALVKLRKDFVALRERGAGGDSDPQVALLAQLRAQDRDAVRTVLIVAAALLVEVGSGRSLWLALAHWEPRAHGAQKSAGTTLSARRLQECSEPTAEAKALPAPPPAGEVADLVDRLHPARGRELRFSGIYRSYEVWCRERDVTRCTFETFSSELAGLAREWGIAREAEMSIGLCRI